MEKNQIAGCFSFEIREADHEKKTLILYTPDQLTSLKNIEKFTSCCGRVLIDDAGVGIPWPVDYSNKPVRKVLGCSNTQNKGISNTQF